MKEQLASLRVQYQGAGSGPRSLSAQRVLRAAGQPPAVPLLLDMTVTTVANLRRSLLIHNIPNVMHDKVNGHCNNGKTPLSQRNKVRSSYTRHSRCKKVDSVCVGAYCSGHDLGLTSAGFKLNISN